MVLLLIGLPITSAEFNRQFKVENIAQLLNDNGVRCNEFNNVVFQSDNNENRTNETPTQQDAKFWDKPPNCIDSAKFGIIVSLHSP